MRPAALYQRNCAACHGEKGDGDSRARKALSKEPRNFTTEKARQELPREFMIAIIRDGKHETPMAARKSRLSQEQIEAIVDFIHASFMPPEPGSVLAHGHEVYREICAGCHGDRGQKQGESKSLSLTSIGATLTRDQMLAVLDRAEHAKSKGNTIAGFATRLSTSDREAVADYIRSVFGNTTDTGRSFPPAPAKAN
ncbi:MAG: c-type cytochrome [Sterolibacterium sp.]